MAIAVLVGSGCCAQGPATEVRPLLPPGQPQDLSAEQEKQQALWRDEFGPDGLAGTADDVVIAPADDVDELLEDLARWKTWARALVTAGRWRR